LHNINIPKEGKLVRLEINYYVFELTPITPTKCKLRIITNVNPKLKFIPKTIISFVARKVLLNYIKKVCIFNDGINGL
jgi:hypothetical protein